MINVSINNTIKRLATGATIVNALEALGYKKDTIMIGVAVNKTFVPKNQWDKTPLNENDEVDILNPISGG